MNNKIKNFFRSDIDEIKEYEILDSNGMIKLDAMENYESPFATARDFRNCSSRLVLSAFGVGLYRPRRCQVLIFKARCDETYESYLPWQRDFRNFPHLVLKTRAYGPEHS